MAALSPGWGIPWIAVALLLSQAACSPECKKLALGAALGTTDVFEMFEEFLLCMRDSCEDVAAEICGQFSCDEVMGTDRLVDSVLQYSSGNSRVMAQVRFFKGLGLQVSAFCPRTCLRCESNAEPALQQGPCEPGWRYADGECYKYDFHRQFEFSGDQRGVRWRQAEDLCQAQGAHLALVQTPAQEHLIFELVNNRPLHLGPAGLWAWVGLWSGTGGCSHGRGWQWVGDPEVEVSSRIAKELECNCTRDGAIVQDCTNWVYTNHIWDGRTVMFESARFKWAWRRAWICSKPARFHTITNGSCEDAGLLPFTSPFACEVAAQTLLWMNRTVWIVDDVTKPYGCWMEDAPSGVRFARERADRPSMPYVTPVWPQRTLLCRHPNATEPKSIAPEAGEQWVAPRVAEVDGGSSGLLAPVVVAVVLLTLLTLLVVLRRVRCLRRALDACRGFRSLRVADLRRCRPEDTGLTKAVELRLCSRRDTLAGIASLLLLGFHIITLLRTQFTEGMACTATSALPRPHELLVSVQLAQVASSSTFIYLTLASSECKSARCRQAWVLAIMSLGLAESMVLGEQALLLESRLYKQLLWRLLVGACASPALVLPCNLVLSVVTCAGYRVYIPDGMVFTVGTMPAGLFHKAECNTLWDAVSARMVVRAIDRCSSVFTFVRENTLRTITKLMGTMLSKTTNFTDFLATEATLLVVVFACLLLLHLVLCRDATQSIKLQSSIDQLSAVSKVLDHFCDATFQLAPDCLITTDALNLDVLLHLEPSRQGMKGRDFRDLIARAEDRARFEREMAEDASGFLSGDAIYLDMRAAANTITRVQLLCAQFCNTAGERHLLCGVNELDRSGARSRNADPSDEAPGPLGAIARSAGSNPHKKKVLQPQHRGTPSDRVESGCLSDDAGENCGATSRMPSKLARCAPADGAEETRSCSSDASETCRRRSSASRSCSQIRQTPTGCSAGTPPDRLQTGSLRDHGDRSGRRREGSSGSSPSSASSSSNRGGSGLPFVSSQNLPSLEVELTGEEARIVSASGDLRRIIGIGLVADTLPNLTDIVDDSAQVLASLRQYVRGAVRGRSEVPVMKTLKLSMVCKPVDLVCRVEVREAPRQVPVWRVRLGIISVRQRGHPSDGSGSSSRSAVPKVLGKAASSHTQTL